MTKIICIGEVLWDKLPNGLYIGGAPLNVATNLRSFDIDAQIISAVGDDELGRKAVQILANKGFNTNYLQINTSSTGLVEVELNSDGIPSYCIKEPVAWDFIEWNSSINTITQNADYICFGSLAQRNEVSQKTILKVLEHTTAKRIFDLNIRAPYYDFDIIHESLILTDILKINDEELELLLRQKGKVLEEKEAVQYLQKEYDLDMVIITKGEKGAVVLDGEIWCESPGINTIVKDTVGAGDAFLAAFIFGFITYKNKTHKTLNFANHIGAFVASKDGATPELSKEINELLIKC
ncbi:MAG: carbohydrate kinase [Balneolaceae bacterium]